MTISNEAVEAASRVSYEYQYSALQGAWELASERVRDDFRREQRAAIEAAAPLIQAEALEEAAQEFGDGQSANYTSNVVHSWLRVRAAKLRQP